MPETVGQMVLDSLNRHTQTGYLYSIFVTVLGNCVKPQEVRNILNCVGLESLAEDHWRHIVALAQQEIVRLKTHVTCHLADAESYGYLETQITPEC